MATQLDEQDDELDTSGLEIEDEPEQEAEEQGAEDEDEPVNDDEPAEPEDADEDVISFGGVDLRGEDEPEHISDLRKRYREQQRELQQLREAVAPKVEEQLGPKPNLDDYWEKDDPQGEFERDLLAWNDRKGAVAKKQEQQREAAAQAQREYEEDVGQLETQRAALKVRDFDTAWDRVTENLDDAQQAILVQVAKNKAALVYGLGKNPDRLESLGKIKNYAKFAGEVARLDMETRVSRKPTTRPEGAPRGAGTFNGRGATDAKLARLEAEAARSQDRTALIAYKRTLRVAGR